MVYESLSDFRKVNRYVAVRNRQYSVSEPFAHDHGFSLAELLVLIPLFFDEYGEPSKGCTQSEIVVREGLTKQTVSMIIKNYEKKGWVDCQPDPQDRRRKRIMLTVLGRQNTEDVVQEFTRRWNRAISVFSDEEYSVFMDSMEKLANSVHSSFERADIG